MIGRPSQLVPQVVVIGAAGGVAHEFTLKVMEQHVVTSLSSRTQYASV